MESRRPSNRSCRLLLKSLVAVCVAVVALCAVAEAKEGTVRKTDRGLVDVAKRTCGSILWTSEASWHGRLLDSSRIKLLKVGDVIAFPDQCMTEKPPKAVRSATLRLFRQEEVKRQEIQMQKANAELLAQVIAELAAADRETLRLKAENAALRIRAENAETEAKLAAKSGRWWRNTAVISITLGVLGVVMALTGWVCFYRMRIEKQEFEIRLERSQESLREARALKPVSPATPSACFSVEYEGEVVPFNNTSVHSAGCNYCSETKLKPHPDNLTQHLGTHSFLRVKEEKLEEIERLLASAA